MKSISLSAEKIDRQIDLLEHDVWKEVAKFDSEKFFAARDQFEILASKYDYPIYVNKEGILQELTKLEYYVVYDRGDTDFLQKCARL